MPKGLSMAAAVDVDFPRDIRLANLTLNQRWVYLTWWLSAVNQRREYLPIRAGGSRAIAKSFGFDEKMTSRTLSKCLENGLLEQHVIDGETYIRVCGVRAKHAYLKHWHDEFEGELRAKSPRNSGGNRGTVPYRTDKEKSSPVSSPEIPPKATDDERGIPPSKTDHKPQTNGGSIDAEWVAVFDAWQECMGRILSSRDIERITEMITTYSAKAVANAITIAHENNGRSLAYIQRVLENGRIENADTARHPNAFRNAKGRIVRDSKGQPITPRQGLIPKWDDQHMDIVGWVRNDS